MRIAPVILTAALLSISTSKTLTAQQNSASGEPEVYQVRPNFYMLNGFGGNIGVQIGRTEFSWWTQVPRGRPPKFWKRWSETDPIYRWAKALLYRVTYRS